MAALNSTKAAKVREILQKYGKEYYGVHELSDVESKIIADPTEETINKCMDYLYNFGTLSFGYNSYLVNYPTTMTKDLAANNIKFAMAEIRAIIAE